MTTATRFFHRVPSAAALVLGLLAAGLIGCSSSSGGLPVNAGSGSRAMPDAIEAYGFYHVGRPQLVNPSQLDSTERFATVAGQKMGLFGVQGVRYRAVVTGGKDANSTAIEMAYGGDLVNTTVESIDSLECAAGGHWVVAKLRVPFVYNEGDGVVAAITSNPAYTVVVPVSEKSVNGPAYVPIRALEAVLKHLYNSAPGTFEGTAYFLECRPRVKQNSVSGRSPTRRWTSPPSMSNPNPDGSLTFDVEVVVAEGYIPPGLQNATLRPASELLPK